MLTRPQFGVSEQRNVRKNVGSLWLYHVKRESYQAILRKYVFPIFLMYIFLVWLQSILQVTNEKDRSEESPPLIFVFGDSSFKCIAFKRRFVTSMDCVERSSELCCSARVWASLNIEVHFLVRPPRWYIKPVQRWWAIFESCKGPLWHSYIAWFEWELHICRILHYFIFPPWYQRLPDLEKKLNEKDNEICHAAPPRSLW